MYKKSSELTPVELAARREAARQRKAKHDLKQKMGAVIDYATFELLEDQKAVIHTYTNALEQKIILDLPALADSRFPGRLSEPEREMVFYVASIVAGMNQKFVQEVSEGVLFGGIFGDAAARQVIEFVHRDNTLLASPTFAENYKKMLAGIDGYFRGTPSSEIRDVRAAIAGTYKLPPDPAPVPVIGFVTEQPAPRPVPLVAPILTAADLAADS